jgi:hypothetical protein
MLVEWIRPKTLTISLLRVVNFYHIGRQSVHCVPPNIRCAVRWNFCCEKMHGKKIIWANWGHYIMGEWLALTLHSQVTVWILGLESGYCNYFFMIFPSLSRQIMEQCFWIVPLLFLLNLSFMVILCYITCAVEKLTLNKLRNKQDIHISDTDWVS